MAVLTKDEIMKSIVGGGWAFIPLGDLRVVIRTTTTCVEGRRAWWDEDEGEGEGRGRHVVDLRLWLVKVDVDVDVDEDAL